MFSLVLPLLLAQSPHASREERVLALLSEAQLSGSYRYGSAIFESIPPPLGNGPVLAARFPDVYCGNCDSGTFDDVRVRRLARELFGIYGLTVQADVREVEGEKSVVLDGLDPVAKVGFKLRGRGCRETFCDVVPEDATTALDETEFAWLSGKGYRLHIADVAAYRAYGDEFSTELAYFAGLVRFLNETTDGEDVDLGGLLFEREAAWKAPFVEAEGLEIRPGNYGPEFVVEHKVSMTITCRGLPDLEAAQVRDPWRHEDVEKGVVHPFRSTHGAPSVLYFSGEVDGESATNPGPEVHLRLRQVLEGNELTRDSRSFAVFLPGAFDLTKPFELELELSPGRYYFYGLARIGAAARE